MTRLSMLDMTATVLGTLPGCDPDEGERDDALDEIELRCAVLGGCGSEGGNGSLSGPKGNTSFLGEINGEGVFPLNELPITGGPAGAIRLRRIRSTRCQAPGAGTLHGNFISVLNPSLSVGAMGELGPLTVTDVANPTTQCQVTGSDWSSTRWTIRHDDGMTLFTTTLHLIQVVTTLDVTGAPLYEFRVDGSQVPNQTSGLHPTCDEDTETNGLGFFAYLVPGLTLDASGNFASAADRVYMACASGSIGKAMKWGYKPFLPAIGPEGHEVAHNAIRAEYCADNRSYTQPGTPVWFQSVFTEEGPDPSAPPPGPEWKVEAVWSADPHAPAICIGTTRRPEHLPEGPAPFPCMEGEPEAFDIPRCTEEHLTHEDAVLATWASSAVYQP